jgi:hypothetical protein
LRRKVSVEPDDLAHLTGRMKSTLSRTRHIAAGKGSVRPNVIWHANGTPPHMETMTLK